MPREMDSDSEDLQDYINALSRKTHDLQYGDHESTSTNKSESHLSSDIEIVVKKPDHSTNAQNIEKQSAQTSKVKELEEKYLKRPIKSAELSLSSSFSEYNVEFEDEKLATDIIHTFPDETTLYSSAKPNVNKKIIKASQIKETLEDHVENKSNTTQIKKLSQAQSFEEDIKEDSNIASQSNSQRKLSDTSSLLNKDSIFYSKNDKAGRRKSSGKIIFRMRSNTLSESDTIKSDVTSTVSEEIPELMQNENEVKEKINSAKIPKKVEDEVHNYDENTFENSEDSSSIKSISNSSKLSSKSISSQKSDSKSATESTVSEKASSEVVEKDDSSTSEENHSSSNESSSTNKGSNTSLNHNSSNETSSTNKESDESLAHSSSNESVSTRRESDKSLTHSSSNESASNKRESDKSLIQYNHQKVKKRHHKTKNIIEEETPQRSCKSKTRIKDEKIQRENKTNKRKIKMKQEVLSSASSSVTSTVTSSISSSFYVKMKKKKYSEKKRKLKQEKELTELIIKLLIKNLPLLLRQTIGLNSTAELLNQQPRSYVCHHCGGNSVGLEQTQKRIDDALRQTVDLTKHFLESQKTLVETQYSHLNSGYRYTTLKNYST